MRFHDTDFTTPTVNIQPEGDVTLVNLATYFEVEFPEAGFGPDEIDRPDPARLLGYDVEVRPRLKSVTYHLGDETVGPTTDLGGPYPSGTVVHTYTAPGSCGRARGHRLHRAVPGWAAAGGSTSRARSTSKVSRSP